MCHSPTGSVEGHKIYFNCIEFWLYKHLNFLITELFLMLYVYGKYSDMICMLLVSVKCIHEVLWLDIVLDRYGLM
jgi:hypothetical protein